MDPKFQTSFIPKKPILSEQKPTSKGAPTSVFMFVCTTIFLVSLAGAGLTIFLKSTLNNSQQNYIVELQKAEERFDTALIEQLRKANVKINLTEGLLKNHLAVSEIFSILSRLTIEGVRFTSFDFSSPEEVGDGIRISLEGVGNSFSAIAFQSDVFGKSREYGTNKVIRNPVVSDLELNENGTVGFTFTALISPAEVSYESILTSEINPELDFEIYE